jgi:hypothetical protein
MAVVFSIALVTVSPDRAAAADVEAVDATPRDTSLAVVPGPFFNPNQGLGLMIIGMGMFHPSEEDTVSPPSIAGLAGMYAVQPPLDDASTRYSYAFAAASRLFLDEDRWRLQGIVAYFDLFRRFQGIGGDTGGSTAFDYRQLGAIAFVQAMREVGWKHFYAGVLAGYVTFKTKTGDPQNEQILESVGAGAEWRGQPNIGMAAQFDTKNNQYYPSGGVDFNMRLNGSVESGSEYLVVVPSFNQYLALVPGDRLVLAYRFFGQFGFGDALPLASYAYYGSRGTTLGYASGDYVDKMMAGVEGELRWLFWWRLGLEAGLGIGKVFPSFDAFGPQPWLPGGWVSITSKLIAQRDVRARLTVAAGRSGGALYFGVGQTF